MKKKYQDLIKIAYPLSNINYIKQLNDRVLESNGQESTGVFEHSLLEPETIEIMEAAGIFNKPNRQIK